ncbi:MAG: 50S ribosomal protein L11 methyltransferase [Muribaculaceae bacterium]|nr:50S ribosomal protein L11 methyltransferase [Muribaculaceae bacterium]
MNDYIEVRFDVEPCDATSTDVLAAMLCDVEFESFVPDESGLTAYVKRELYNEAAIADIVTSFPLQAQINWRAEVIEGQDWNSEWEKNYFQPIVVGDKCVIHSSFHTDIPKVEYDIVIDPKMAFGTGHHATTSLIIRQLLEMSLDGLSVMDMGTGTGILAILSAMRGAEKVSAIEIDEFAYVNAVDNVKINGEPQINVMLGDASLLANEEPVDVFIANINRNIITADIAEYAKTLKSGGTMLLSGFYEEDVEVIMSQARLHSLDYQSHTVQDRWTCLRLVKQ